jgi:hypothetical protein
MGNNTSSENANKSIPNEYITNEDIKLYHDKYPYISNRPAVIERFLNKMKTTNPVEMKKLINEKVQEPKLLMSNYDSDSLNNYIREENAKQFWDKSSSYSHTKLFQKSDLNVKMSLGKPVDDGRLVKTQLGNKIWDERSNSTFFDLNRELMILVNKNTSGQNEYKSGAGKQKKSKSKSKKSKSKKSKSKKSKSKKSKKNKRH